MRDFEIRKIMWATLGRVFSDVDALDLIWIFSIEDMHEINRLPDGVGNVGCIGVVKDAEP